MLLCLLLAIWLSLPCLLKSLHWCKSLPLRDSKHPEVGPAASPYFPQLQQVPSAGRDRATDVVRMDEHWQNGKRTTHLMVELTGNNVGSVILWNCPESQHWGSLELYKVWAQGEAVSWLRSMSSAVSEPQHDLGPQTPRQGPALSSPVTFWSSHMVPKQPKKEEKKRKEEKPRKPSQQSRFRW